MRDGVLEAATAYAVGVFAFGFLFGGIRVLLLAPQFGPLAAVLIELPFMLIFSWHFLGYLLAHFSVGSRPSSRALLGALAFLLLMAFEASLGLAVFGQDLQTMLAAIATPPGLIGLAGQLVFALIPLLHRA